MAVFIDELDPKMHRIALFAAKDIKPGEELTFDYEGIINGPFNVLQIPEAPKNKQTNRQKMACYCQSESCRKFINL